MWGVARGLGAVKALGPFGGDEAGTVDAPRCFGAFVREWSLLGNVGGGACHGPSRASALLQAMRCLGGYGHGCGAVARRARSYIGRRALEGDGHGCGAVARRARSYIGRRALKGYGRGCGAVARRARSYIGRRALKGYGRGCGAVARRARSYIGRRALEGMGSMWSCRAQGALLRREGYTKKGGQWPPFPIRLAWPACRPCPAPSRRLRGAEAAGWCLASASRPAGPARGRP